MLKKGELFSNELISDVLKELEYTIDFYDSYYDIGYRDMPTGHGKSKYYYCYSNVQKVCRDFAQEILYACHFADDALSEKALEIITNLVNRYNEKIRHLIQEKLNMVDSLLGRLKSKSVAVLPEKIDGGSVQIDNNGITHNGKLIAKRDSYNIGLTYTKNAVFVYDGTNILKCYIKNGFLQKDIVCPSEHYVYGSIYGYKGLIAFQPKDEYGFFLYDCNTDRVRLVDDHAYQLCGCKGKLFYTRIGWEKNLYASKDLVMCDYNGESSKTLKRYPGGSKTSSFYGVYYLRLEGEFLKYEVVKHNWTRGGKDEKEEKSISVDDLINAGDGGADRILDCLGN